MLAQMSVNTIIILRMAFFVKILEKIGKTLEIPSSIQRS